MYDIRGVKIKEGSILLWNGTILKVKSISTNILVGGSHKVPNNVIPGEIVCEARFNVNSAAPIPVHVLADTTRILISI